VDTKVTEYFSKFWWSSFVESYATRVPMLAKDAKEGLMTLEWCIVIDNIRHGREDHGS